MKQGKKTFDDFTKYIVSPEYKGYLGKLGAEMCHSKSLCETRKESYETNVPMSSESKARADNSFLKKRSFFEMEDLFTEGEKKLEGKTGVFCGGADRPSLKEGPQAYKKMDL